MTTSTQQNRARSPVAQSTNERGGSNLKVKVITAPPWARDEPPSPTDVAKQDESVLKRTSAGVHSSTRQTESSDVLSIASTSQAPDMVLDVPGWWWFTRRGRREGPPHLQMPNHSKFSQISSMPSRHARLFRERSKTWLSQKRDPQEARREISSNQDVEGHVEGSNHVWDFHIPLPSASVPFTLAHARTPGWDTPWSPRMTGEEIISIDPEVELSVHDDPGDGFGVLKEEQDTLNNRSIWYRRKKRLRLFVLNNEYVPLLFRFTNITLTTAALAVAVKIRLIEGRYGLRGAVGSSPTLVIIFAPLTLVHVVVAIYLEYFGRPLGLWRTSMKLAHTLSDTFLICAWSAALSLCFDNFFTAIIGCVPPSSISWYNQIQRPLPDLPNLGRYSGGPADQICNRQLALICLVGLSLIMYCTNLVISLFRIFEKIKYHPNATPVSTTA